MPFSTYVWSQALLLNINIKIHFYYKHYYVGEQVDLDNLQIFRGYQSYHSWTSATVLNDQALIVTKKITSMVTLAELDILSKHLGMSLQVEPGRNGRLWVYKNNDNTIISNKDFGDISTTNSMNFTVCQVQKDVITFHTQLKNLAREDTWLPFISWILFKVLATMWPSSHFLPKAVLK